MVTLFSLLSSWPDWPALLQETLPSALYIKWDGASALKGKKKSCIDRSHTFCSPFNMSVSSQPGSASLLEWNFERREVFESIIVGSNDVRSRSRREGIRTGSYIKLLSKEIERFALSLSRDKVMSPGNENWSIIRPLKNTRFHLGSFTTKRKFGRGIVQAKQSCHAIKL